MWLFDRFKKSEDLTGVIGGPLPPGFAPREAAPPVSDETVSAAVPLAAATAAAAGTASAAKSAAKAKQQAAEQEQELQQQQQQAQQRAEQEQATQKTAAPQKKPPLPLGMGKWPDEPSTNFATRKLNRPIHRMLRDYMSEDTDEDFEFLDHYGVRVKKANWFTAQVAERGKRGNLIIDLARGGSILYGSVSIDKEGHQMEIFSVPGFRGPLKEKHAQGIAELFRVRNKYQMVSILPGNNAKQKEVLWEAFMQDNLKSILREVEKGYPKARFISVDGFKPDGKMEERLERLLNKQDKLVRDAFIRGLNGEPLGLTPPGVVADPKQARPASQESAAGSSPSPSSGAAPVAAAAAGAGLLGSLAQMPGAIKRGFQNVYERMKSSDDAPEDMSEDEPDAPSTPPPSTPPSPPPDTPPEGGVDVAPNVVEEAAPVSEVTATESANRKEATQDVVSKNNNAAPWLRTSDAGFLEGLRVVAAAMFGAVAPEVLNSRGVTTAVPVEPALDVQVLGDKKASSPVLPSGAGDVKALSGRMNQYAALPAGKPVPKAEVVASKTPDTYYNKAVARARLKGTISSIDLQNIFGISDKDRAERLMQSMQAAKVISAPDEFGVSKLLPAVPARSTRPVSLAKVDPNKLALKTTHGKFSEAAQSTGTLHIEPVTLPRGGNVPKTGIIPGSGADGGSGSV